MRITFIADARTLHARRWIQHFVEEHTVQVISTYPCDEDAYEGCSMHNVPLLFSARSTGQLIGASLGSGKEDKGRKTLVAALQKTAAYPLIYRFWRSLVWLEMWRLAPRVRHLMREFRPDLVQGLRLPVEGLIAAQAGVGPLAIQTWGNDLTLWSRLSPLHNWLTRRALGRADVLFADCQRDIRLAREMGFREDRPAAEFLVSGGVDQEIFHAGPDDKMRRELSPTGGPIVLYTRGVRDYVALEPLLRAVPRILQQASTLEPKFVFLGIQEHRPSLALIRQLGIESHVLLRPFVSATELARVLRAADVYVSPGLHDGTPNSMIEAMACGVFPVVGDIESLREWIVSGHNGLLCDPLSSDDISEKVARAIADGALRRNAAIVNGQIVAKRASRQSTMAAAESLCADVVLRWADRCR